MKKKRLLWHLFPYFLAVSLLSILAASWHVSQRLYHFYVARTGLDLEARARLLRPEIESLIDPVDSAALDALCKRLAHDSNMRITVILPDGSVAGASEETAFQMENHADRPEIADALQGRIGTSTRYSSTRRRNMMYVAIPIERDGNVIGVLRTALALYSVEQPFRAFRLELLAGIVFLFLLAGIGSFAVSRRISRPIEEMKAAAERFALGNLSHRVPVPEEPEELGELAQVLNRLAGELGDKIALLERQSNEQGTMFASMMEGVVAIDENRRVINLNPAAERLLGIRPGDAFNRSLHEVIRNSALHKLIEQAFKKEESVEGDIVIFNGEERYLLAHVTTLKSALGRSTGAMVVLNDVTRLRKLENLRRDFAANVSHELKTPITSIKGFVETLLEGAVNHPDDARRFLGIIAKHTDRLNSIIEDLLSLSRIEQQAEISQVPLERASIRDVLNTAVQLCQTKAAARDIRIEIDCPPDLAAHINAPLMEQAIVNLIDNAVKFSVPGKPVLVRAAASEESVLISIRDEGPGIAAEHLPRIFERFYRVDKARSRQLGGTGLGLSIVRHIVLAHGGQVDVDSTVGMGSTFTIALPART